MITMPIWLFIISIIIGFPLLITILTILCYTIYIVIKITIETLKSTFEL